MDCLPGRKYQMQATTIPSTITTQERAASVMNSTTLGLRVAVELEPNVCVVKSKAVYIKGYTLI